VNVPIATYSLIALGLAIIYLFPRLTRAIPSPLVAIVVLTILTVVLKLPVRTVADLGELPSALPTFGLPDVPFTLETLRILLPVAMTLAAVGLLESLLTAQIVDDMTDTPSNKNRECVGQGGRCASVGRVLCRQGVASQPRYIHAFG
jgi:sulfate permease, SulP family